MQFSGRVFGNGDSKSDVYNNAIQNAAVAITDLTTPGHKHVAASLHFLIF